MFFNAFFIVNVIYSAIEMEAIGLKYDDPCSNNNRIIEITEVIEIIEYSERIENYLDNLIYASNSYDGKKEEFIFYINDPIQNFLGLKSTLHILVLYFTKIYTEKKNLKKKYDLFACSNIERNIEYSFLNFSFHENFIDALYNLQIRLKDLDKIFIFDLNLFQLKKSNSEKYIQNMKNYILYVNTLFKDFEEKVSDFKNIYSIKVCEEQKSSMVFCRKKIERSDTQLDNLKTGNLLNIVEGTQNTHNKINLYIDNSKMKKLEKIILKEKKNIITENVLNPHNKELISEKNHLLINEDIKNEEIYYSEQQNKLNANLEKKYQHNQNLNMTKKFTDLKHEKYFKNNDKIQSDKSCNIYYKILKFLITILDQVNAETIVYNVKIPLSLNKKYTEVFNEFLDELCEKNNFEQSEILREEDIVFIEIFCIKYSIDKCLLTYKELGNHYYPDIKNVIMFNYLLNINENFYIYTIFLPESIEYPKILKSFLDIFYQLSRKEIQYVDFSKPNKRESLSLYLIKLYYVISVYRAENESIAIFDNLKKLKFLIFCLCKMPDITFGFDLNISIKEKNYYFPLYFIFLNVIFKTNLSIEKINSLDICVEITENDYIVTGNKQDFFNLINEDVTREIERVSNKINLIINFFYLESDLKNRKEIEMFKKITKIINLLMDRAILNFKNVNKTKNNAFELSKSTNDYEGMYKFVLCLFFAHFKYYPIKTCVLDNHISNKYLNGFLFLLYEVKKTLMNSSYENL